MWHEALVVRVEISQCAEPAPESTILLVIVDQNWLQFVSLALAVDVYSRREIR
jgi:hypothetical protein